MTPTDTAAFPDTAINEKLDDLLCRWHRYSSGYSLSRSKTATDSMFRDTLTWSRAARDAEQEEASERHELRTFDQQVRRVPNEPTAWFTALSFHARNLATGSNVWFSPRLPADPGELEIVLLQAKVKLAAILARDGAL